MKHIFLYKRDSDLTSVDLDILREDGYLPIGVDSFDDVKIINTIQAGASTDDVYGAMVEAFNRQDHYAECVRQAFGHNLAKRLLDNLRDTKETPSE